MSDVICIVAFRTDTDRAVKYKKLALEPESKDLPPPTILTTWAKVAEILRSAYGKDRADFVSIRFIRQPKSEGQK